MTTPLSTPFGLFKASLEALAAEKRWPLKRYQRAFKEAERQGFVRHDPTHQVILIPKFLKYCPPKNSNILKGWIKLLIEIPPSLLRDDFMTAIELYAPWIPQSFLEPFRNHFEIVPETISKSFQKPFRNDTPTKKQKQKQKQKQDLPPIVPPPGGRESKFGQFWRAYPRKKSKGAAEKAWRALTMSEQLHDRILCALERATTSPDWQRDGGQFIPYPATWLRAKGWEDEDVTGHGAGGVLTANLGPEVET